MFPLGIASRGSFKRQIILTFVVGFFALTATFAFYLVQNEKDSLYRDSNDAATGLARSLAVSSRSWVLANDVVGLQEVVHSYHGYPELRYAMVISPTGRVMAHSDETKVGQFVTDEQSLALIKTAPGIRVMEDDQSIIDIAAPVETGKRQVGWVRVGLGREAVAESLRQMSWSIALFVLFSTLLSLLAAVLVVNRLGRRIGTLVSVAQQVQAGNFATRVARMPGREDEITGLANSLNLMLDVLARNEQQLRSVSLYTRSLIEASLDPLVTISPEGKITDVNHATEAATGLSRKELIGTDFSDCFAEPEKARKGYQEAFLKGFVADYPLVLRHRDGRTSNMLYNASVYKNEKGEVMGVFAAARDITEHRRAELARSQLAAIVESSSDAIIGNTLDGIVTSWNKGAEKVYGYSADEIVGKQITILAPPSRHAEVQELLNKIRRGGIVADFETERLRKDGARIDVALTLSPIRNAAGDISGVSTFARDITERKKAEVVLRQSEEALKEAQRIAHLGSWHLDIATNQVVWSEELYKLYGFDPALPPPLYTESMKLFTPESWERLSTAIARATEAGTSYELELETVQKDGGRGWMWARGELVRDARGMPFQVRGVVMDISGRKQAEERLRRSEHGLAEAQRIAHLGNWELDLVTNMLTWSDEIYRIFEIDRERFGASYEAFLNAIHPDDRDMVNKAYTDSLKNKMPYDIVHRLQMKDGRIKYVNEKCETYYGDDGRPLRSVGTVHDITERKLDEETLLRLNRELHAISNCNQLLMRAENEQTLLDDICRIVCDDAGYIMAWVGYPENDEARTIRPVACAGAEDGYLDQAKLTWADTERGRGPSGTAIRSGESVSIPDFITTPSAAPWRDAALQRGYRSSIALPLKDDNGQTFGIFNIYADKPEAFTTEEVRLLEELAGDLAFGIKVLRARIERQRAEAALRENERFLDAIVEHIPNMLFVKDARDLRFVRFNVAGEQLLGYSRDELIGKSDRDFFPKEQADFFFAKDRQIFASRELLDIPEEPIDTKSLGRRFLHTRKIPIFAEDGTPQYLLGISEDVTERKRAVEEIKTLNLELEQRVAARTADLELLNKELESFSYSVSHDLRTPLRAIDGFSHILLDDYADKLDDEGKRLVNVVRDNTRRMGQLIDDILKFSRTGRIELVKTAIDMQQMAQAVFDELQSAVTVTGTRPKLELEAIPSARGDSAMMRQVFVNLLSNAIKFSRNKESPVIRVGSASSDGETIYYVKDNGVGFDMRYTDKLFGVFQRLHSMEEFEGTGIGLAIVKRIVTRHGGRVWAEGKVGEGATVYFALPQNSASGSNA